MIVVAQMFHIVSLTDVRNVFVCRPCLGLAAAEVEVLVFKCGNDQLEVVDKFCFLRDMLSSHGGVNEGVSAWTESAWKKFRELCEVLTGKQGLSLK